MSSPPEPVFFVDRALGDKKVPDALRQAGGHVEIHSAHFAQDAQDVEWLSDVGERGWLVLTKDKAIRKGSLNAEPFWPRESEHSS